MEFRWIDSLLVSYYYNRDVKDIVKIIERTINRLKHHREPHEDIDVDVDIFVGALVCMYGDYGTSPRYGWIEKYYEMAVMEKLEEELEEYKEIASRSTD